jgi:hypothetical protein
MLRDAVDFFPKWRLIVIFRYLKIPTSCETKSYKYTLKWRPETTKKRANSEKLSRRKLNSKKNEKVIINGNYVANCWISECSV